MREDGRDACEAGLTSRGEASELQPSPIQPVLASTEGCPPTRPHPSHTLTFPVCVKMSGTTSYSRLTSRNKGYSGMCRWAKPRCVRGVRAGVGAVRGRAKTSGEGWTGQGLPGQQQKHNAHAGRALPLLPCSSPLALPNHPPGRCSVGLSCAALRGQSRAPPASCHKLKQLRQPATQCSNPCISAHCTPHDQSACLAALERGPHIVAQLLLGGAFAQLGQGGNTGSGVVECPPP